MSSTDMSAGGLSSRAIPLFRSDAMFPIRAPDAVATTARILPGAGAAKFVSLFKILGASIGG